MSRKSFVYALVLFSLCASPALVAQLIKPYPGTGHIAPPLTKIDKYAPVLNGSKGTPIDPGKGYALLDLGNGAYFATEGIYQVLFIKTDNGLVFSGMLGVTFFGLFLTPVFYVVVRSLLSSRRPGNVVNPVSHV